MDINALSMVVGDMQPYFYNSLLPKPIDDMTREEWMALRPAALVHMMSALGIRPIMLKTHHCNALVDGLSLIPSGLTKKAIYIVRDPRDIAISVANHFSISIDEAIDSLEDEDRLIGDSQYFSHILNSWSFHVKSWIQENRYPVAVLRYEDLYREPEYRLTSLIQWLTDEDANEFKVKAAVEVTKLSNLQWQEQQKGFKESPKGVTFFMRGGSYWHEVLTPEQARRIEDAHGEMMEEFGYLNHDTRALQSNG